MDADGTLGSNHGCITAFVNSHSKSYTRDSSLYSKPSIGSNANLAFSYREINHQFFIRKYHKSVEIS